MQLKRILTQLAIHTNDGMQAGSFLFALLLLDVCREKGNIFGSDYFDIT